MKEMQSKISFRLSLNNLTSENMACSQGSSLIMFQENELVIYPEAYRSPHREQALAGTRRSHSLVCYMHPLRFHLQWRRQPLTCIYNDRGLVK